MPSGGGSQLKHFIKGDNPTAGDKATCLKNKGDKMIEGDHWTVVFDTKNVEDQR